MRSEDSSRYASTHSFSRLGQIRVGVYDIENGLTTTIFPISEKLVSSKPVIKQIVVSTAKPSLRLNKAVLKNYRRTDFRATSLQAQLLAERIDDIMSELIVLHSENFLTKIHKRILNAKRKGDSKALLAIVASVDLHRKIWAAPRSKFSELLYALTRTTAELATCLKSATTTTRVLREWSSTPVWIETCRLLQISDAPRGPAVLTLLTPERILAAA